MEPSGRKSVDAECNLSSAQPYTRQRMPQDIFQGKPDCNFRQQRRAKLQFPIFGEIKINVVDGIGKMVRVFPRQQANPTNQMKKPLAHFRYMTRQFIAKLDGMKFIMRVETARTTQWWLVLPARGESDSVCVFLHKMSSICNPSGYEKQLLSEYSDRIVNA